MSTMSEKEPLLPRHEVTTDHSAAKRQKLSRDRARVAMICVVVLFLFHTIFAFCANPRMHGGRPLDRDEWVVVPSNGDDYHVSNATSKKVKLEAHIMSKCPDARDCLKELILPAMQEVSDKVDFTLSYIGQINDETDSSPITCKHGPQECLGNIIELCASSLYPDPMIYLGFTMCLSESYSHIPERSLIQECALEHGVDFHRLNECAEQDEGSRGMDLLRMSVARSQQVGAKFSCTVRLEDEVRCIMDGGKWKDCPNGSGVEDLVRDIKKAAAEKNEL